MSEAIGERKLYIGCAVWGYKEWVGDLFPAGSKSGDLLSLYSRRLTTVEGNTSFYATPRQEIVQRWAAETPETFRFCFKLPREVSHEGPLSDKVELAKAFIERMSGLGERLGPYFLQLPPSYHPRQIEDLAAWLTAWPPEIPLAVELRHIDWYDPINEDTIMQLLTAYGVGRVVMDVRPLDLGPLPGAEEDLKRARDNKPDVPMHPLRSAPFAMVRYIGHPDIERNGPLLDEWADRIVDWIAEGTTVYFFLHCPVEARSPSICRELQRRLNGRPGIPELPWDTLEGGQLEQATLF
jgi:uncharacterized protein YecE (DUF72 family)